MHEERTLIGWVEIAQFFRCSERKIRKYKQELTEFGALFYMNIGKPPHTRACAFPSHLKDWQKNKSINGKII